MSDDEIERLVFIAMQYTGWLIPQTEQAVERAEQKLAKSEIVLPARLLHPPKFPPVFLLNNK